LVLGVGGPGGRRAPPHNFASEQIDAADRSRGERNYRDAWILAQTAARNASGSRLYNAAISVLARVALDEGRFEKARNVLSRTRPIQLADPHLQATIERMDGQPESAIVVLEAAQRLPAFHRDCARLLVELHAEANNLDRAVEVAITSLALIGTDDIRRMICSLKAWGEFRHAAILAMALSKHTGAAEDGAQPPSLRRPLGNER
jgi:hypothetical protein